MPAVEIVRNPDGSYSAFVYGKEVFRGTREECEARLKFEGGDWQ